MNLRLSIARSPRFTGSSVMCSSRRTAFVFAIVGREYIKLYYLSSTLYHKVKLFFETFEGRNTSKVIRLENHYETQMDSLFVLCSCRVCLAARRTGKIGG